MSKVTLYMAVSADGFIAGPNDETPWSDDEWMAFQAFVRSCDVCLVGRRTYEIMRDGGELIAGVRYVVVTQDKNFESGRYEKMPLLSKVQLPDVEHIGAIGGGRLNGTLAGLGLIDEIILDIEPLVLGQGRRLFGDHAIDVRLALLSSRQIGKATVQNRYRVLKEQGS